MTDAKQDLLTHLILGTATQEHFFAVAHTFLAVNTFCMQHAKILEPFHIGITHDFQEGTPTWVFQKRGGWEYTIDRELTPGKKSFSENDTYTVTRSIKQ